MLNVLLLMGDQHRGDCLSCRGHPVVETPHLDALAARSMDFRHAASATALCAPARRTLLTGQKASRHGVLDANVAKPVVGMTLPQVLASAGWQTHLVGKLHLWPRRQLYGFQSADWADWFDPRDDNDYTAFMRLSAGDRQWIRGTHGFDPNSRRVCTWALSAELHFSSWCRASALRFLERRDTTRSFFLFVSFIPPHPPLLPLEHLLAKYVARYSPPPVIGEWAQRFAAPDANLNLRPWRGRLDPQQMHLLRSAYYASLEHLDEQIGHLLAAVPRDTLVIYLSDHGDMLGDHYLFRKRLPYEAATNIPLLVQMPTHDGSVATGRCDHPVELMDVMPTVLDYLGLPIPESVDGISLLPLIRGHCLPRRYIHGESPGVPSVGSGMQFITDGIWKYIWYPERAWEQLFDLRMDPTEEVDLVVLNQQQEQLRHMRAELRCALGTRFTTFAALLPALGRGLNRI